MVLLKDRNKYSDDYSEKLIPTRVTITRQHGNLLYVFEVDGYIGEKTGEISYKGSEVERIERLMKSNNAIQFFSLNNVGPVFSFETPQAITSEGSLPTGTALGLDAIFKVMPQEKTTQFIPLYY